MNLVPLPKKGDKSENLNKFFAVLGGGKFKIFCLCDLAPSVGNRAKYEIPSETKQPLELATETIG